ncbi:MAG: DNA-3-methyladenine glycosylase family protein [Candidatus Bathyarchaeia archaeon]
MEIRIDQSASPFNLDHTLGCGQAFRWEKLEGWWHGVVRKRVIKIRQIGDKLEFQTSPRKGDTEFVRNYFRLDDPLPLILSKIDKDQYIRRAIHHYYGLRITRQDPWECLISYLCATYKNIPAIKNMILNLAKEFGKKMRVDDHNFYMFPEPLDLAEASLEELKKCKLGYRAEQVLETSRIIHKRELDLEALRMTDYEEAKRELLQLPGVGQKVADCVLLFSLDKLEAFPVDIWMRRAILKFYSEHFEKPFVKRISEKSSLTPAEYRKIGSFGSKYFGEYAGYAQEYLFHLMHSRQDYCQSSSLTRGNSGSVSSSIRKPLFK